MSRFLCLVLTLAVGLAGCSGPLRPAGLEPSAEAQGVPAKSINCDKFPVGDVEAVAQQVVAGAKAERAVSDPADQDGSVFCPFHVFMPGTDLTAAGRGQARVSVRITNGWDTEDSGFAGQRESYKQWREAEMAATPPANSEYQYSNVSGVGAEAYLQHWTRTDSNEPYFLSATLVILRERAPYKVESFVEYMIPPAGVEVDDKALDVAIREEANRAKLAEAFAKAVLPKIG